MTKARRAQVVEFLRCAADQRPDGVGLVGMFGAHEDLGEPDDIAADAWNALTDSFDMSTSTSEGPVDERYRHQLLEAAARLEEQGKCRR